MILKNKDLKRAFTLIELLVVISIIALLSSIVLASLRTAREKAQDSKIVQDLRQFGIAEQLYYDSYHSYALGNENTENFAVEESNKSSLINVLNVFSTKRALATLNNNCVEFNRAAGVLVASKYLSAVPKHPKDNGVDICYKSAKTTTNFTAYSPLITTTNKNVGVILGDPNLSNLQAIYTATNSEYPRATDNGPITDLASAGDAILSTTGGTNGTIETETPSAPTMYTLNVATGGTGSGSIGWNHRDINTFEAGTVMTIIATPDEGSEFTGWSNSICSSDEPECEITMDSNIYISAIFDEIP